MDFIVGAVVGLLIAISFILPHDVISLQLATITIVDILLIVVGLVVVVFGAVSGFIVWTIINPDE
jgi:hypothetical protein